MWIVQRVWGEKLRFVHFINIGIMLFESHPLNKFHKSSSSHKNMKEKNVACKLLKHTQIQKKTIYEEAKPQKQPKTTTNLRCDT